MEYKLEDLIDIPLLQSLQDKLNVIYSFPSAIIDNDGKILTAVAWQDICTQFHRKHPECEKECIKSDRYIIEHLKDACPAVSYQCPHGLIDNAAPIIIDGTHLGNFFTGQFFLEKPDQEFFRKQAHHYGFDEQAYMEAVNAVPIWTKEKLDHYIDFITGFIEIIAGIGLNHLREIESHRAIIESEERNRAIVQSTSDWIWETDARGRYSFCSARVEKILGYTSEEIIGRFPFDLMPAAEKERVGAVFQEIIKRKGPIIDLENWNLHKDGHLVCLLTNGVPVLDENGNLTGYRGADKDITERITAEKIIQKTQLFLDNVIEQSPHSMWISDEHGTLIRMNQACRDQFVLTDDEVVGKYNIFYDNVIEEQGFMPKIKDVFENGIKTRFTTSYDTGLIKGLELRHTSKLILDVYISPILDLNGKVSNVIVQHVDNTERVMAEAKIREKDIEFRKLSANVPDLIFQFTRRPDGSYCVPIASEGIINIFGCTPEEVIDNFEPIGRVIHPEDAERVIRDIEYSAEHLTYFTCEFRVQIPGREIQWIYSRSTPEKLADGSVTWYGFNVNITEHKKTEMELIEAKEKAEESDRLKSAFLANMSHEIRTPMNGILGFAELLKEPNLTGEEQQSYIEIIEKSGKRMLNIIHDIVDISKIESGQMEVTIEETDLNNQLGFIYDFFKPEADLKGIQLIVKNTLSIKDAMVFTDREKIYAILTNLVKNAIKYTHKGSIEFGCNKTTNGIRFFVKDTGAGIPEERLKAVFERFIQADISNRNARDGAGLGLSIARAYVEMLGGKIWVESKYGEGSTFYFTIPGETSLKRETLVDPVHLDDQLENKINNMKILIAEDDEASEFLFTAMFKKFQADVLYAKTGVEAVQICRDNPDLDLVLMDIRMPAMNGYEATRLIRQFNKEIFIVAQTAFGMTNDRAKAIDAGCNDYISKPIRMDKLLMIIRLLKLTRTNKGD